MTDAWLDGGAPQAPLRQFDTELDRLRCAAEMPADAWVRDAVSALEESATVFEDFRQGLPMTAEASKTLEATEDRIAQALSDA